MVESSSPGPLVFHTVRDLKQAPISFVIDALSALFNMEEPWPYVLRRSKAVGIPSRDKIRPIAVAHPLIRLFSNLMADVVRSAACDEKGGARPLIDPQMQLFLERDGALMVPLIIAANTRVARARLQNQSECMKIMALDAANAFNSVGARAIKTAIDQVPNLTQNFKRAIWRVQCGGVTLPDGREVERTSGLKQGDPLSPVLFALSFQPYLVQLRDSLRNIDPLSRVIAYADDVSIIYSERNVERWRQDIGSEALNADHTVYQICQNVLRGMNLRLNEGKTQVARLTDKVATPPTWERTPEGNVVTREPHPLVVCGVEVLDNSSVLEQRFDDLNDFVRLLFRRLGDGATLLALRTARVCAISRVVYHITGTFFNDTDISQRLRCEEARFADTIRECLHMEREELPDRVIIDRKSVV